MLLDPSVARRFCGNFRLDLPSHSVRKLLVPIRRFDINPEDIENVKFQYQMRQYVRPDHPLTKSQEDERKFLWVARKELIDRLFLIWTSSRKAHGFVPLDGIKVTPEIVSRLRPINLDVQLRVVPDEGREKRSFQRRRDDETTTMTMASNSLIEEIGSGETLKEFGSTIVECFEFVTIDMLLRNEGSSNLTVSCEVIVRDDVEVKSKLNNLAEKLLWSGSLEPHFPIIQGGQTLSQRLDLSFTSPGYYSIRLKCHIHQTRQIFSPPSHLFIQVIDPSAL